MPMPRCFLVLCCAFAALCTQRLVAGQVPVTGPQFKPVHSVSNYVRRTVAIPMRDGVNLHGVILIPKGVTRAGMLLTLTPYDADALTSHTQSDQPSGNLEVALQGYDNPADIIVQDHYIRVVVDVRGKYGSGGRFVMTHTPPLHGPSDPRAVNDATDVHDTIAWLVQHVPESNGKVGIIGISYDGHEALMGPVLTRPLKLSGRPGVHFVASTSGTDSDWVVKLIDVYPAQVAAEPELGGYQLIISGEIFRGRYRKDLGKATPLEPGQPLVYAWHLPVINHVFAAGHRLMIQIQSSWFPLYDRNPQTFVPNIFFAKPSDYVPATQRVYRSPSRASYLQLPVVTGGPYADDEAVFGSAH